MKDKDLIPIEKWIKKAKKLKKEYDSFDALIQACNKILGKEYFELRYLTMERTGSAVVVNPLNYLYGGRDHDREHPNRDLPFYIYENNKLVFMDRMKLVNEIAPLLKDHIDREMLMKDFLQDQEPDVLLDLKARLFEKPEKKDEKPKPKKGVSIKKTPGCFEIKVGGKRGPPLPLMLRE